MSLHTHTIFHLSVYLVTKDIPLRSRQLIKRPQNTSVSSELMLTLNMLGIGHMLEIPAWGSSGRRIRVLTTASTTDWVSLKHGLHHTISWKNLFCYIYLSSICHLFSFYHHQTLNPGKGGNGKHLLLTK